MLQQFQLIRLPQADIRQIRANALRAQHCRLIIEIILRHALHDTRTPAPTALGVRAKSLGTHLLAVAIETSVRPINLLTLARHPGPHWGIRLAAIRQLDRLLPADL